MTDRTIPVSSGDRLGARFLFFGWITLLVVSWATGPVAEVMAGGYSDGPILIRPWMWTYNTVILLCHLLCLAVLFAGVLLTRDFMARGRWGLAGTGAAVCWALAMTIAAAMLLFPWRFGYGPWMPSSLEVRLLRALVFGPSVMRAAGFGLLVGGLASAVGGAIRGPSILLLGLAILDLALSVWKWISTPKAVIALLHPYATEPLLLLPSTLAGVLFLLMVREKLLKAEPGN